MKTINENLAKEYIEKMHIQDADIEYATNYQTDQLIDFRIDTLKALLDNQKIEPQAVSNVYDFYENAYTVNHDEAPDYKDIDNKFVEKVKSFENSSNPEEKEFFDRVKEGGFFDNNKLALLSSKELFNKIDGKNVLITIYEKNAEGKDVLTSIEIRDTKTNSTTEIIYDRDVARANEGLEKPSDDNTETLSNDTNKDETVNETTDESITKEDKPIENVEESTKDNNIDNDKEENVIENTEIINSNKDMSTEKRRTVESLVIDKYGNMAFMEAEYGKNNNLVIKNDVKGGKDLNLAKIDDYVYKTTDFISDNEITVIPFDAKCKDSTFGKELKNDKLEARIDAIVSMYAKAYGIDNITNTKDFSEYLISKIETPNTKETQSERNALENSIKSDVMGFSTENYARARGEKYKNKNGQALLKGIQNSELISEAGYKLQSELSAFRLLATGEVNSYEEAKQQANIDVVAKTNADEFISNEINTNRDQATSKEVNFLADKLAGNFSIGLGVLTSLFIFPVSLGFVGLGLFLKYRARHKHELSLEKETKAFEKQIKVSDKEMDKLLSKEQSLFDKLTSSNENIESFIKEGDKENNNDVSKMKDKMTKTYEKLVEQNTANDKMLNVILDKTAKNLGIENNGDRKELSKNITDKLGEFAYKDYDKYQKDNDKKQKNEKAIKDKKSDLEKAKKDSNLSNSEKSTKIKELSKDIKNLEKENKTLDKEISKNVRNEKVAKEYDNVVKALELRNENDKKLETLKDNIEKLNTDTEKTKDDEKNNETIITSPDTKDDTKDNSVENESEDTENDLNENDESEKPVEDIPVEEPVNENSNDNISNDNEVKPEEKEPEEKSDTELTDDEISLGTDKGNKNLDEKDVIKNYKNGFNRLETRITSIENVSPTATVEIVHEKNSKIGIEVSEGDLNASEIYDAKNDTTEFEVGNVSISVEGYDSRQSAGKDSITNTLNSAESATNGGLDIQQLVMIEAINAIANEGRDGNQLGCGSFGRGEDGSLTFKPNESAITGDNKDSILEFLLAIQKSSSTSDGVKEMAEAMSDAIENLEIDNNSVEKQPDEFENNIDNNFVNDEQNMEVPLNDNEEIPDTSSNEISDESTFEMPDDYNQDDYDNLDDLDNFE